MTRKVRTNSKNSVPSSEILGTTKIIEQETKGLEMTLEAKREESNQRDSPFTIATKCECFAFVII